jgi:hypothetical protein
MPAVSCLLNPDPPGALTHALAVRLTFTQLTSPFPRFSFSAINTTESVSNCLTLYLTRVIAILKMEATPSSEKSVYNKPNTSQKTEFFIVTAVKTSNPT